jgi:hypothetical protein
MQISASPRIRRATLGTAVAAALPLTAFAVLTYFAVTDSADLAALSGNSQQGMLVIAAALLSAVAYVSIAFPVWAYLLHRRGKYSGHAFRRGQSVILAAFCLAAAATISLLLGSSVFGWLSLALMLYLLAAILCFPLAFLWLWLAR